MGREINPRSRLENFQNAQCLLSSFGKPVKDKRQSLEGSMDYAASIRPALEKHGIPPHGINVVLSAASTKDITQHDIPYVRWSTEGIISIQSTYEKGPIREYADTIIAQIALVDPYFLVTAGLSVEKISQTLFTFSPSSYTEEHQQTSPKRIADTLYSVHPALRSLEDLYLQLTYSQLPATDEGHIRCVDPRKPHWIDGIFRRSQKYAHEATALPGASAGILMAALAGLHDFREGIELAYSIPDGTQRKFPQLIADLLLEWDRENNRPHTSHKDNQGHGRGCKAVDLGLQGKQPGLLPTDLENAIEYTEKFGKKFPEAINMPQLTEPHHEVLATVVKSKNGQTIPAVLGGRDVFRYDISGTEKLLQSVASFMVRKISLSKWQEIVHMPNTTMAEVEKALYDHLDSALQKQAEVTFNAVAGDLPLVIVNTDSRTMQYFGTINTYFEKS